MRYWLDWWPIHLLSLPRCSSVIRFPDFAMTPLGGKALPRPPEMRQLALRSVIGNSIKSGGGAQKLIENKPHAGGGVDAAVAELAAVLRVTAAYIGHAGHRHSAAQLRAALLTPLNETRRVLIGSAATAATVSLAAAPASTTTPASSRCTKSRDTGSTWHTFNVAAGARLGTRALGWVQKRRR